MENLHGFQLRPTMVDQESPAAILEETDALGNEEAYPDFRREKICVRCAGKFMDRIHSDNKMEYFLFPRALALAEVAWMNKEDKDYKSFTRHRLPHRLHDLENLSIFFRIPEAEVNIKADKISGGHQVEIIPFISRVYYTIDGHKADQTGTPYNGPFIAPQVEPHQEQLTLKYILVTSNWRTGNEFEVTIE